MDPPFLTLALLCLALAYAFLHPLPFLDDEDAGWAGADKSDKGGGPTPTPVVRIKHTGAWLMPRPMTGLSKRGGCLKGFLLFFPPPLPLR